MIDISQAEEKPVKFGEPLTSDVDGNPEPSSTDSSVVACVETRRRVCIKCGNEIPQTKYKNAVYCSEKCRNAYVNHRWRVNKGLIESPGVGSGGNQLGQKNHQYKTGIGTYSKRAFDHYGRKCNRCPSKQKLLVHHKDEDRSNNELDNLEVLCKRCHQEHHCKRDLLGKYTKG